jgi:hypothetical protein
VLESNRQHPPPNSPPPHCCVSKPPGPDALRSLRLRHTLPRFRTYPNLRVCQLVKVLPREEVTPVCRRWPLAMPASGSTHPRFRGIALFPEPGDFTASPAPCQGPSRGPKSRFQRRASLHHGRLAAARRGRFVASPEPNEYRTSTSLCQVPGPSRFRSGSLWPVGPASDSTNVPPAKHYVKWFRCPVFSHARSLSSPAPAGLTRRPNCASRGRELYVTRGVRARGARKLVLTASGRGSCPSSGAGRAVRRSPGSSPGSWLQ